MDSLSLYLSAALAVAIPALATGWAQSRIGPAAAATLAEKPELSVTVVLLIAIPETVDLSVTATILQPCADPTDGRLSEVDPTDGNAIKLGRDCVRGYWS